MPSPLAKRCVEALSRSNSRLVLAESCTGGLVAADLTSVAGVSQHFCGSAVTYRNATKQSWLNVDADVMAEHTAVCEQVARMMATGVLAQTPEATLAASITGHLGPGAPDGFDGCIFIGIATRSGADPHDLVTQHRLRSASRAERQREAADWVLGQVTVLLSV